MRILPAATVIIKIINKLRTLSDTLRIYLFTYIVHKQIFADPRRGTKIGVIRADVQPSPLLEVKWQTNNIFKDDSSSYEVNHQKVKKKLTFKIIAKNRKMSFFTLKFALFYISKIVLIRSAVALSLKLSYKTLSFSALYTTDDPLE